MGKKKLLIQRIPLGLMVLLFFVTFNSYSQTTRVVSPPDLSFFGHPGLIYSPSAYLSNWGDVNFGMTHYPAPTSFTFERGESQERSFWTHIGFLPFGEVSVKLTKPYNASDKNYGIGDRSISFRLQVLKEKQNSPAILIGVQDPFSVSSYFNTNYIVLSKKKQINQIVLNANIGYGFKIETARAHTLQGVFGGLQTKWKQLRLVAEYDTEYVNVGAGYQYKNWLSVNVALINVQYISASLSISFSLKE